MPQIVYRATVEVHQAMLAVKRRLGTPLQMQVQLALQAWLAAQEGGAPTTPPPTPTGKPVNVMQYARGVPLPRKG